MEGILIAGVFKEIEKVKAWENVVFGGVYVNELATPEKDSISGNLVANPVQSGELLAVFFKDASKKEIACRLTHDEIRDAANLKPRIWTNRFKARLRGFDTKTYAGSMAIRENREYWDYCMLPAERDIINKAASALRATQAEIDSGKIKKSDLPVSPAIINGSIHSLMDGFDSLCRRYLGKFKPTLVTTDFCVRPVSEGINTGYIPSAG